MCLAFSSHWVWNHNTTSTFIGKKPNLKIPLQDYSHKFYLTIRSCLVSCLVAQYNLYLSFTVLAPSGLCLMPLPAHQSVNYWWTSGSRFRRKTHSSPPQRFPVLYRENKICIFLIICNLDQVGMHSASVGQSTLLHDKGEGKSILVFFFSS